MTKVAIIGCGVIGAAIAYELSQVPDLDITVLDQNPPAQAATGAALGVLVGIISQKTKGRAWELRSRSLQRYETLIPELEAIAGQKIPYNRQGILNLCFIGQDLRVWENLVEIRRSQGWLLHLLTTDQVQAQYPAINCQSVIGAVYSPQDRQVDPVVLTLALVKAAQHNGATFQFGVTVEPLPSGNQVLTNSISAQDIQSCQQLQTSAGTLEVDWVVIAAGLGTTPLAAQAPMIRPVLGQALQVQLETSLGQNLPVITGEDVHIVAIREGEYWIGATVEFLQGSGDGVAEAEKLNGVMNQAISMCPGLRESKIVRQWSGLRPRPEGQAAPVIQSLPGFDNVLLATGHYRNGVLLAPATAQLVREMIVNP
ncbi:MAG: NAD(P)/FAD-dependent oxidoreductase [Microcoleaceae cyanobacterium]